MIGMQSLILWLEDLALQVPVTWFTFIGALVEEVIAPIPSPLVMTLAGSIAASQNQPLLFLFLLALIGALGKTIGSLIIYVIADKAEDIVISKFGRMLGVSHDDTEGLGAFFGRGVRDDIAIFLLRAIPIMPTAPVSAIAGIIKLDLKIYLTATFLGLAVRNMLYLYLGYTSVGALESVVDGLDSLEKIGYFMLAVAMGLAILWMYRKRQQGKGLRWVQQMMSSVKRRMH